MELNRRNFLRLRPIDIFRLARTPPERQKTPLFRPPGAIQDEAQFLATCERCHQCSSACPYTVIDHFGPAAGRAEGTPFLNPATTPCHWCPTMDCIHACPSGALSLGDGEFPAPIGKAFLNTETCLNSYGTLCDTCSLYCPPDVGAIQMINRFPRIDEERCVGCGLCAYYCEASPSAIDMVAKQRLGVEQED